MPSALLCIVDLFSIYERYPDSATKYGGVYDNNVLAVPELFPKIGAFVIKLPVVFITKRLLVAVSKLKTIPTNVAVSNDAP